MFRPPVASPLVPVRMNRARRRVVWSQYTPSSRTAPMISGISPCSLRSGYQPAAPTTRIPDTRILGYQSCLPVKPNFLLRIILPIIPAQHFIRYQFSTISSATSSAQFHELPAQHNFISYQLSTISSATSSAQFHELPAQHNFIRYQFSTRVHIHVYAC